MRATARLGAMRQRAESRMTDTCRITRPDPDADPVWNPVTGKYDQPTITLYEGKCRLRMTGQSAPASTASAGPESWLVREPVLSLPIAGTEAIGASDQTCEYLTAAFDQALVGRKFGFTGPAPESQATARRLVVKEVAGVA